MFLGNNLMLLPMVITAGVPCQLKSEADLRPRKKRNDIGELSQAVKALREALGQTQQQFANTLNTAITTIARYETGRPPQGQFLARLAEVASQNNQLKLADVFRGALTRELGSWDSAGYTLGGIEPRNDQERLYVAAVLSVLRNEEYIRVIPRLNKALRDAATMSIQIFEWTKRKDAAQLTAKEMADAGSTPDDIAARLGAPVEEVRKYLSWVRLIDHLKTRQGKMDPKKGEAQ
jgi:transcriptional regulator with XRE-family HTH domain